MDDRERLIRLLTMVAEQSQQHYQPVATRRREEFDQAAELVMLLGSWVCSYTPRSLCRSS